MWRARFQRNREQLAISRALIAIRKDFIARTSCRNRSGPRITGICIRVALPLAAFRRLSSGSRRHRSASPSNSPVQRPHGGTQLFPEKLAAEFPLNESSGNQNTWGWRMIQLWQKIVNTEAMEPEGCGLCRPRP